MATKTQVNTRYNNEKYKERQNPSIHPEKPGQSLSVPHLASTWKSPNFDAINFMDKLFGSADALMKLAKTEEGKQYRQAQARALRGDYTIDDSGLITFKGAQQKALSEVEGTNDAAVAQDALLQASEEFRKQLAGRDDLTPAQKIQAHRALLQKQAYASLSPDKDTDYLIAKGSRLNVTVNQLSNAYRDATIQSQLNEERDKTVGALQANLNMMPVGISKEAQADFMKGSLAKFAESWGIVTGQPISSASPVLKKHVNDLVVKGDRDMLLRLKDFEISKGVTMESLGIITEATLDSADRQAISLMQRDTAMRKAQAEKYVFDVGNQIYKIYQNSQKYSEMDMEKYLEQQANDLNSLAELKTAISNSNALPAEVKESLNYRISSMEAGIQSGGQLGEMSTDDQIMLHSLNQAGNVEEIVQYFKDNPFIDAPKEFTAFKKMAMQGDSPDKAMQFNTWMQGVLADTPLPDDGGSSTPDYASMFGGSKRGSSDQAKRKMQSDLMSAYLTAKKEIPDGGHDVWAEKAEEIFRKKYPVAQPEQRISMEAGRSAIQIIGKSLNTINTDDFRQLASTLPQMSDADRNRFMQKLQENTTIPQNLKDNLISIITSNDLNKQNEFIMPDADNTAAQFPLNPKYLNTSTPVLTAKKDTFVFAKSAGGKIEQVVTSDISSDREGSILTSPIPWNARFIDETGKIRKVSELTTEADIAKYTARRRPAILPDGGTEQNPVARDLSGWEHGNKLMLPNLSNQEKPLEDHYVIIDVNADTLNKSTPSYKAVRYGSVMNQPHLIASTPFDPDMTVAVREGLTSSPKFRKMRNIGSHLSGFWTDRKYVDFISPISLENMSFEDQVQIFTPVNEKRKEKKENEKTVPNASRL